MEDKLADKAVTRSSLEQSLGMAKSATHELESFFVPGEARQLLTNLSQSQEDDMFAASPGCDPQPLAASFLLHPSDEAELENCDGESRQAGVTAAHQQPARMSSCCRLQISDLLSVKPRSSQHILKANVEHRAADTSWQSRGPLLADQVLDPCLLGQATVDLDSPSTGSSEEVRAGESTASLRPSIEKQAGSESFLVQLLDDSSSDHQTVADDSPLASGKEQEIFNPFQMSQSDINFHLRDCEPISEEDSFNQFSLRHAPPPLSKSPRKRNDQRSKRKRKNKQGTAQLRQGLLHTRRRSSLRPPIVSMPFHQTPTPATAVECSQLQPCRGVVPLHAYRGVDVGVQVNLTERHCPAPSDVRRLDEVLSVFADVLEDKRQLYRQARLRVCEKDLWWDS